MTDGLSTINIIVLCSKALECGLALQPQVRQLQQLKSLFKLKKTRECKRANWLLCQLINADVLVNFVPLQRDVLGLLPSCSLSQILMKTWKATSCLNFQVSILEKDKDIIH